MKSIVFTLFFLPILLFPQGNLPLEVKLTEDEHLRFGANPTEGLYDTENVNKLEIILTEANWFELLDGEGRGPNATAGESLIGSLIFNDSLRLDSVLVSIKGQTSDFRNNSEKKSFKIEIDEIRDQDLLGYDNLNLNGGYEDASMMREVLYYDISRAFTPALKGAFVDLYINGTYWGPYHNIQQIEGRYINEWFSNNDGTRWRAVSPDEDTNTGGPGGPGGPGGAFGTGVSSLNYNGADATDYSENYTLKKTSKENPWEDLILVCDKLNNVPISNLYDELTDYLDIDRTLWFLAQEIVFSDDDSYINKGGMDYYVYWDQATGRIVPLEVDGNSVMTNSHVSWNPFFNENDERYPLLNRLLQNEEIRQRYLAHVRTILEQHVVEEPIHARIDEFATILDQRIQNDPKNTLSYTQFINGVQDLKNFITNRIAYLGTYSEIDRTGLHLSNVARKSTTGSDIPSQNEAAHITIEVDGSAQKVILYYGLGLDGAFDRVEMYDDGLHNDQLAGDNVYGNSIPGVAAGNYVRYYIEAIKDDDFGTASYIPAGAEHDVFVYRVSQSEVFIGDVVINEFMASNDSTSIYVDQDGEHDDWIELYNTTDASIDLSGFFLSDNPSNLPKYQVPDGTRIDGEGYLVIWADEDGSQDGIHANFKLAKSGEEIYLLSPDTTILDHVVFGQQETNMAYARQPNGTGDFVISRATFNQNNDFPTAISDDVELPQIQLYPNPVQDLLQIKINLLDQQLISIHIFDMMGKQLIEGVNQRLIAGTNTLSLDVQNLSTGMYTVIVNISSHTLSKKFIVHR